MTLAEIFNFIENAYTTIPWWQSLLIYGGLFIIGLSLMIFFVVIFLKFMEN